MQKAIFLKDYEKPTFKLLNTILEFHLDKNKTTVNSLLTFEKFENSKKLNLYGEDLKLISIEINNIPLENEKDYFLNNNQIELNIEHLEKTFDVKITVENYPNKNTKLSGLYQSGDILCTQNEPEGFRRITYFPDRPDVMSKYKTKIIADKKEFPILLSNGNLIEKGDLENNKHFTVWEDPFNKPSYLFALVAGELDFIEDSFTTSSGREVKLEIYTDLGKSDQATYAMTSLKKAMKWDEERFNLEYDLDRYMIVAVDSFNFGAMENKGLNIFNSSFILIDEDRATDQDYLNVDAIVAHEYFHNWTGNRVTCRDWFQLTLKEGLTVFREQLFCEDIIEPTIQRIIDVDRLKNFQFIEDSGTNAHPIQPKEYIEIDNFYTMTVYEKGAEVIRMMHTMLGEEGFQKGMKLYFKRHDGQAVTTEDFVNSMVDANDGFDLDSFKSWYDVAGTPELFIRKKYNRDSHVLKLEINQKNNKNTTHKFPSFPFKITLFNSEANNVLLSDVLQITKENETFEFKNIYSLNKNGDDFVFLLNQNFSAPVKVRYNYSEKDYTYLLKNDQDIFNRYNLMQSFMKNLVLLRIERARYDISNLIDVFKLILEDKKISNFEKSYILKMPSYPSLIDEVETLDIPKLYRAVKEMKEELATSLLPVLKHQIETLPITPKSDLSIEMMGIRALKITILSYLSYIRKSSFDIGEFLFDLYNDSDSMTEKLACLETLNKAKYTFIEPMGKEFLRDHGHNLESRKKYFTIIASNTFRDPLDKIKSLMKTKEYDEKIPNLVRGLIVTYAKNYLFALDKNGKGLDFIAEQVEKLDSTNPSLASAILKSFQFFDKLDNETQELIKDKFRKIYENKETSSNAYEIVSKFYR